jgi:hypothetical protein
MLKALALNKALELVDKQSSDCVFFESKTCRLSF